MWQSLEILNTPYVNFEAFKAFLRIFWKKKKKKKKRLKTQHYHAKLLSEANFKTNRMSSTKWTYHKELDLPVTTFFFFFWEFGCSVRTSNKELIWCTNDPNVHIHTFRKRWSFVWGLSPVSILNGWSQILKSIEKNPKYYLLTSLVKYRATCKTCSEKDLSLKFEKKGFVSCFYLMTCFL